MKAITAQTPPTRTRRDVLRQGLATGAMLSLGGRVLGASSESCVFTDQALRAVWVLSRNATPRLIAPRAGSSEARDIKA